MKIGHIDNAAAVTPVAGERQGAAPAKNGGNGPAEASAQVELSSTAAMLGDGAAEFDADKVKRIAQAIRDGQYKVNPEAIADKLIANAQELLGKASH